jgi:Mg-chelatase subunit ChlD
MKTEIIAIADTSGSMNSVKDDANGGFNNFLSEQRDVPGECRVTLVKFNSSVEQVYQGVDVKVAEGLDLKPRGNTALYDALGVTLVEQSDRIKAEGWADLVIVVVSTDGQENSSKEFTLEGIKAMIKLFEEKGWKFVWLMSNQDAFTTARMMGSSGAFSMSKAASGRGEQESYSYASSEVRNMRTRFDGTDDKE